MKPYLTYGAFIAIGNAVITLVLFLAGFHSEPERLQTAQIVSGVAGLAIGISLLVIGVRAKRAQVPVTEEFSYGKALGTAVMISLFATLFSATFQFIYASFINSNFAEVAYQAQVASMQAKGVSSAAIEKSEGLMRMMLKPAVQAGFAFVGGMFANVIISLIAAAILRRRATEQLLSA